MTREPFLAFFSTLPPKLKCPKNWREGQGKNATRGHGDAPTRRFCPLAGWIVGQYYNAVTSTPRRVAASPPRPLVTSTSFVDVGAEGAYGFHLILQPTLGRCSVFTGCPASTASTAARRSAPVTGTSLRGRAPSNWPR